MKGSKTTSFGVKLPICPAFGSNKAFESKLQHVVSFASCWYVKKDVEWCDVFYGTI